VSVGDVNSSEKGSGARYNDGKAPLQYIPMRIIARMASTAQELGQCSPVFAYALHEIADFEEGKIGAEGLAMALAAIDCRLASAADVFEYGSKKYAAWNWAKGMQWSIPLACIKRHALAFLHHEANDPESGLSHIGHIACNAIMLLTYVDGYTIGDDRPSAAYFEDAEEFEATTADEFNGETSGRDAFVGVDTDSLEDFLAECAGPQAILHVPASEALSQVEIEAMSDAEFGAYLERCVQAGRSCI
jgi:Domain of unknown function (DUF5664)